MHKPKSTKIIRSMEVEEILLEEDYTMKYTKLKKKWIKKKTQKKFKTNQ
jgi:hypothetical protein